MGYAKGQSGNPRGRPRGRINQARLRETVAEDLPAILRVLASRALDGDTQAAALLLSRTLPPLRPTDSPVTIPLPTAPAAASRAVLAAVAAGRLTPDQGARLLAALVSAGRLAELEDLAARVAALEETQ